MEKLVCVLWKPEGASDDAFAASLLGEAKALQEAGATALRIDVVDEAVAAGSGVRVGSMDPPKAGFVSFWLHEADDRGPILERLAPHVSRLAAYLVVESEPLRREAPVPPGERTPGFNLVTCIEPKQGLDYARFLDLWHHEHRAVAIETQRTLAYVRNEVVRPLTPDAPPWAAIVEEGFPSEALTDPEVWYDCEGDPALLAQRRKRMVESVVAFLALDRVESHPMSEYRF